MIPKIPDQRKFKAKKGKPFNDLLSYIEAQPDQSVGLRQQLGSDFSDVIDYATAPTDQEAGVEKCIAIRTHGVTSIATASLEMNAVAQKNTRCPDPVFHIILSWPEHEKPAPELIFDAAEHAIRTLGLGEHQYVLAVHGNTDNMHCHISVNRIHPRTYKSHNIAWSHKNLHRAARESEIKHGWSHDTGLFVVEVDADGKKQVVPNKDRAEALHASVPRVHPELGSDELLPVWHDPDSLDSWLKTTVAKALKGALARLDSWAALHTWLGEYDIALKDSGGGGLRLSATSTETGEVLDLAASKGLRRLKRAELEKRWGPYTNRVAVPAQVSDLSHLSPQQLAKGVAAYLAMAPRPPQHVLLARQKALKASAPVRPVPVTEVITKLEQGLDTSRSTIRDTLQRAQRKEQRAAARLDLRQRFAQYQQEVRQAGVVYFAGVKALQAARRLALAQLREQDKAAKHANLKTKDIRDRFVRVLEIENARLGRRLQIDADQQVKAEALSEVRVPPLSWRAWLLQQAGQGDQAALSALRGIVYQAQRDAKGDGSLDEPENADEIDSAQSRARRYQKLMARLLEEEQKEAAIRSADSRRMRPYEADALLRLYTNMVWHVTGNGNVEYRDTAGAHLFTDRGNRVTFDRVRVEDDEIRLALAHAQQKFGMPLTLTGDDPVFTERMARLADDMGISILNPELRNVIELHRVARTAPITELPPAGSSQRLPEAPPAVVPAVFDTASVPGSSTRTKRAKALPHNLTDEVGSSQSEPAEQVVAESLVRKASAQSPDLPVTGNVSPDELPQTPQERLRAMALAINPNAKFITPTDEGRGVTYYGKVAATLGAGEPGVLQFSTRLDAFILHSSLNMGDHTVGESIEVQYKNGVVTAKSSRGRGGRGD